MTEADWLSATDPTPMLEFIVCHASDRKLRLFAVACCRTTWHLLTDERSRHAVGVAEAIADCRATRREQQAAQADAAAAVWEYERANGRSDGAAFSALLAVSFPKRDYPAAIDTAGASGNASVTAGESREVVSAEQTALARDVFGNPFRPVTLNPVWLTSDVFALAEGIYADRAFDRMPVLADALQDAGCECEEILLHCRVGGLHTRGCWVVDLVLGKE